MKTERAPRDPIARGVLVVRELGGGLVQTQPGPNARIPTLEEVNAALAFPDDRPPPERIHRVELTPAELAELADPDPELEG